MEKEPQAEMAAGSLEALQLSCSCLERLPVDESQWDGQPSRRATGVCFCRSRPDPLQSPTVVAVSRSALSLIGVDEHEASRSEFAQLCGGARLPAGSRPAAHCFCGHQFGAFRGQLGDAGALYLGEAMAQGGQRWELQLSGAGRTPYSGGSDGRQGLRSALREYALSEALYRLGVPTVRAAALVASDTMVVRDTKLDGGAMRERAGSVLRVAPSFLRFGSLEVFRTAEPSNPFSGPSVGLEDEMLLPMLDFIIEAQFPSVWERHNGPSLVEAAKSAGPIAKRDMYTEFLREAVRRTAALCAAWQSVGFVHGLPSTDNMSLLGITMGCQAGGFVELYNPRQVKHLEDMGGYYSYAHQPEVCRWSCEKLSEVLTKAKVTPVGTASTSSAVATGKVCLLEAGHGKAEVGQFLPEFSRCYNTIMRRKLGLLIHGDEDSDEGLVGRLLAVMESTGADYTNTFRWLGMFPMPHQVGNGVPASSDGSLAQGRAGGAHGLRYADGGVLERIVSSLPGPKELAKAIKPRVSLKAIHSMLAMSQRDPRILREGFGAVAAQLEEQQRVWKTVEDLRQMPPAKKSERDCQQWSTWLNEYGARLAVEAASGADPEVRVEAMRRINPRFVPREAALEAATRAAEAGSFSEVESLLQQLSDPFSSDQAETADMAH